MGKKQRDPKRANRIKEKPQKTKEERELYREDVKNKLSAMSLDTEELPPIKKFYEKLDKFVETGEHETGNIDFPEINRKIYYNFTNTKGIECTTAIKCKN